MSDGASIFVTSSGGVSDKTFLCHCHMAASVHVNLWSACLSLSVSPGVIPGHNWQHACLMVDVRLCDSRCLHVCLEQVYMNAYDYWFCVYHMVFLRVLNASLSPA